MTQGIHPLTANMVNQLNRVDTIANNLANMNTVGFKQDHLSEGTFNHYLEKTQEKKEEINPLSTVMNTIPKIDNKFINSKLGSIIPTGNNLDFALAQGDTFFKVKDNNGNLLLTRDGSFKSLDGKLVTQNGYEVLDTNNNPIDADNSNISFVLSVVSTSFKNLDKVGENNYKLKDPNKSSEIEQRDGVVIQASLEQSNVNSIKSMVSLIEAQRKFEQSQKAIAGIDEINKKVIESIGNNR